jgi:putative intracellular protease/amidase/YHS domain-containing protein
MKRTEFTRRELLQRSAALGCMAAVPFSFAATGSHGPVCGQSAVGVQDAAKRTADPTPLKSPKSGSIAVAYPLSRGVVDIDFTGPWAIFGSVMLPGAEMASPFHQFCVAETKAAIVTGSGMTVVPDYTFEAAPQPKIIVIPAQDSSDAMLQWIRKSSAGADLTMSVCVGAFLLAKTGLLDGKSATTHHDAYKQFANEFPKVHLVRGVRFVDEGNLATSGGLASGMDLALHVVERYCGKQMTEETAYNLEYQGQGWKDPNTNAIYAQAAARPTCPVCGMASDPQKKATSIYKGKTYYFCQMADVCKPAFDATPDKYADQS